MVYSYHMKYEPLAVLLRPNSLASFVGQSHLVSPGKPLFASIQQKKVFSMIFWGPPGVGKTTLARIIAQETGREFFELSAVSANKADVKAIVEHAKEAKLLADKESEQNSAPKNYLAPILFLDEIHRFNKAQQDFLLPYVEQGVILLIGATTENPSFEVISALLSRCRVFVLKELSTADLQKVMSNAVDYLQKETKKELKINEKDQNWLVEYSNGDARKLLTLMQNTFELYGHFDREALEAALQSNQIRYDQNGEEHYDTISAFIKSMRASNPDAALYYLARMVAAGEDPLFIARRMVVFASEDIGMATPTALVVANAVFRACETIGYPECQENLAAGVVYLAKAKKDRSAYDAYMKALGDVQKYGNLPIPLELRNAPTKLMKALNYGKGYDMYAQKSLLPEELGGKKYL